MTRIRATRADFVLDVGSGHFPHSTADILVDRFIEDIEGEGHRGHKKLVRDRPLVCADVQALPFKDKSFSYVICNQVLEHVGDPVRALAELTRVGRRGFLSVPSEFEEFICPAAEHRWVFALRDGTLLIKPKQAKHRYGLDMYGGVFHHLHGQTDFRRLSLRRPNLFAVELEWENNISYRFFENDEPFYDYHDPRSIERLIQPVPADGLEHALKRWVRINLDLSQMYQLTRLRARLRHLLKTTLAKGGTRPHELSDSRR
jgi:SAM-dependent methyltransferase